MKYEKIDEISDIKSFGNFIEVEIIDSGFEEFISKI
jgi:hypothetical protein